MQPKPKKYAQIEEAELICRMAEAFAQTIRPAGMTADQCVKVMEHEMRQDWLRVSRAVQGYLDECYANAATIQ